MLLDHLNEGFKEGWTNRVGAVENPAMLQTVVEKNNLMQNPENIFSIVILSVERKNNVGTNVPLSQRTLKLFLN